LDDVVFTAAAAGAIVSFLIVLAGREADELPN
jgi:hypothetical protein